MAIFCCFDQLHRWNAWVTPPLGMATNLGLLWLIVYRTPKEMRIHSGILVQTCLVDLLLLTLGAFVHPVNKNKMIKVMRKRRWHSREFHF
jgi:hypothetical protein